MLKQITAEEREAFRQKAAETLRLKSLWAEENLKQDYADETYWRELASKYKVVMPRWYEPASETKYITRVFRATGIALQDYTEAINTGLKEFAELNPNMPAWVSVGLALEFIEGVKNAQ